MRLLLLIKSVEVQISFYSALLSYILDYQTYIRTCSNTPMGFTRESTPTPFPSALHCTRLQWHAHFDIRWHLLWLFPIFAQLPNNRCFLRKSIAKKHKHKPHDTLHSSTVARRTWSKPYLTEPYLTLPYSTLCHTLSARQKGRGLKSGQD